MEGCSGTPEIPQKTRGKRRKRSGPVRRFGVMMLQRSHYLRGLHILALCLCASHGQEHLNKDHGVSNGHAPASTKQHSLSAAASNIADWGVRGGRLAAARPARPADSAPPREDKENLDFKMNPHAGLVPSAVDVMATEIAEMRAELSVLKKGMQSILGGMQSKMGSIGAVPNQLARPIHTSADTSATQAPPFSPRAMPQQNAIANAAHAAAALGSHAQERLHKDHVYAGTKHASGVRTASPEIDQGPKISVVLMGYSPLRLSNYPELFGKYSCYNFAEPHGLRRRCGGIAGFRRVHLLTIPRQACLRSRAHIHAHARKVCAHLLSCVECESGKKSASAP